MGKIKNTRHRYHSKLKCKSWPPLRGGCRLADWGSVVALMQYLLFQDTPSTAARSPSLLEGGKGFIFTGPGAAPSAYGPGAQKCRWRLLRFRRNGRFFSAPWWNRRGCRAPGRRCGSAVAGGSDDRVGSGSGSSPLPHPERP